MYSINSKITWLMRGAVLMALFYLLFTIFYPERDDVALLKLIAENKRDVKLDKRPDEKTIELMIRLPLNKKMISRLLCDLSRSMVVFWKHSLGDIVLVFDEEDKENDKFIKQLILKLPFKCRIHYEPPPPNKGLITKLARPIGRTYGYLRMIYSSFSLDLYASPNSIIAWADTDVILTMPVLNETIFRNNKLIVKGLNTFGKSWLKAWSKTTSIALGGLPMVSDFMSYFPVYLYPSTVRNCREYILRVLNVKSVGEAMEKIAVHHVSPVSIILSYAYYFERELYEWHIDIGSDSLGYYNKRHIVMNHSLTHSDIFPEIHQSIHSRYYTTKVHPLKQALCFTLLHIEKTDFSECREFKGKVNWQLFEFQSLQTHLNSWCKNERNKQTCTRLINNAYRAIKAQYEAKTLFLNMRYIKLVEDLAFSSYQIECPAHGLSSIINHYNYSLV